MSALTMSALNATFEKRCRLAILAASSWPSPALLILRLLVPSLDVDLPAERWAEAIRGEVRRRQGLGEDERAIVGDFIATLDDAIRKLDDIESCSPVKKRPAAVAIDLAAAKRARATADHVTGVKRKRM